jgi:hypothetical protein
MTSKSLLLIAALVLAGIASAKSYDIVLSSPATAGSVQLAAGEYSLQVQGSNAIFTNVETGKSVTVSVKMEYAAKKFEKTAVDSTANKTRAIDLGGSTMMLEMGD